MAAVMDKLSEFARTRRLAAAFVIVGFYLAWFIVPDLVRGVKPGSGGESVGIGSIIADILPEIGLVATILFFASLFGDWKGMRITSRLRRFWWLALVPPVLYLGFYVLMTGVTLLQAGEAGAALLNPVYIAGVVAITLLVGIYEEFLFRGILFSALERWRGPVLAALLSSALFGAMHYVNWIDGQSLETTHFQVLHAAGSGLMYAGIMLVTGSIWPAVLLHGAWDNIVSYFQSALAAAADNNAREAASATSTVLDTATSQASETTTAAAVAASPLAEAFAQGAILGMEPLYGLVLLGIYVWQQKRRGARV